MKRNKKLTILFIIIGIILSGTLVYAQETILSKNISYDNSNSTLKSTTVQGAIDELAEKSKTYCPSKYKCYKIKSTPEAGDYVKMTPTLTSYSTDTSKTGYTSSQTINPSELNLWRVLKVNNDGTIELISEYVSSKLVYFMGQTGYKNLVGYLNVLASKYENSNYTKGSRYVGYNGQTEYLNSLGSSNDTLYQSDYNLIYNVLGTRVAYIVNTKTTTATYWLASRYYYSYTAVKQRGYSGRTINTSGSLSSFALYRYSNGSYYLDSRGSALRPIVILKSGISYKPSLGIKEDPFVLE